MSAPVRNKTATADDKHSVEAELTAEFDGMWFASEFEEGDDLVLTVGSEQGHATVWAVEPADGVMILDLSAFERQENRVTFADHSTTGPDHINHGFGFSFDAVPVDSRAAEYDAETTHVLCECGTVCNEGRGHSIHCAAHSDNDTKETADEEGDEELPHPHDDPDIKYPDIRELQIMEEDPGSYSDIYYED